MAASTDVVGACLAASGHRSADGVYRAELAAHRTRERAGASGTMLRMPPDRSPCREPGSIAGRQAAKCAFMETRPCLERSGSLGVGRRDFAPFQPCEPT